MWHPEEYVRKNWRNVIIASAFKDFEKIFLIRWHCDGFLKSLFKYILYETFTK